MMPICRRMWLVLLLISIASASARADNWPAWRGSEGTGRCAERDLPVKWSADENVRWKVKLPGDGNSTPVVWGDRVFVT